MKRILIITLALLSLVLNVSAKIHTIGDSTMADYDQAEPDQKGMYGWGQVFGDYFSNGMTEKTGATVVRAPAVSIASFGLRPKQKSRKETMFSFNSAITIKNR